MKHTLLAALCFLTLHATAQNTNNLAMDGIVINSRDARMRNAHVMLIDSAQFILLETKTNAKGRFEVFVPFNQELNLVIGRQGHQPKYIRVNTHNVPPEHQKWGYEFGGFKVILKKGDHNAAPELAGAIEFDTAAENFVKVNPE